MIQHSTYLTYLSCDTLLLFSLQLFNFHGSCSFLQRSPKLKGPMRSQSRRVTLWLVSLTGFVCPRPRRDCGRATTLPSIRTLTPFAIDRVDYINDLRGPLYITDENGESGQLYMDHRDYPLSFDASMMPNETGFAGFAFHPTLKKENPIRKILHGV